MPTVQSVPQPPGATNTATYVSRAKETLASSMPWSSLTKALESFSAIKPFVLARLIRNLIDAENFERCMYTFMCLYDLYKEYMPPLSNISMEAFRSVWDLIVYFKTKQDGLTEAQIQELEPQAFVKTNEISPEFDTLAKNFGLNPENLVKDFSKLEIPLCIVSGLLGLAAIFMGDKIASLVIDPKILQSSLGKTAKMIKDTTVVWSTFENTWQHIVNYIASFFGYSYISDKDHKIQDLIQRLAAMRDKFNEITETLHKDLSKLVQSETGLIELEAHLNILEKEVDQIMKISNSAYNFTYHIRDFRNQINQIREVIIKTKNSAAGKQHPVCIRLCGKPGIGKSQLASYIIDKLSELEGRQLSVYTRNSAADAYWSGYVHQDVVVYDDYAQDAENIDHSEMYGIYTNAAYRLNMADCAQKGTHFTSRYVILCSNQDYIIKSKKVTDIEALNRRAHAHYHVTSPAVEDFIARNGYTPPRNSDIWQSNFSHLDIDQWKTIPDTGNPRWEDQKVLRRHVDPVRIAEEMRRDEQIEQEAYEAVIKAADQFKLKLAQMQLELKQRAENFDELPQGVYERTNTATPPERLDVLLEQERQLSLEVNDPIEIRRAIIERYTAPVVDTTPRGAFPLPPPYTPVVNDTNPFSQLLELQPQSIVTKATGCNQYLLLGPSGCGKSHMLSQMHIRKIHSIEEIMESDGTLKIDTKANLHFEDISITPEVTNKAIEICQRLSDHDLFAGTIIYSANPDMLCQNLAARGEEAIEVFSRRCKEIRIQRRLNTNRFWGYKAKDIATTPGLSWDGIYYGVTASNPEMTLIDIQVMLTTNEQSIKTFAIFDLETLKDFQPETQIILDFPSLTWDQIILMKNYSCLREFLSYQSMVKAGIYLRTYLGLLESLPREYVTPLQLVTLINQLQLRVPEKTPSALLQFKDFHIKLINHKTYVQVQISTPELTLPDLGDVTPITMEISEERQTIWSQIAEFAMYLMGGVMISRELFGWNQNKPEEKVKEPSLPTIAYNPKPLEFIQEEETEKDYITNFIVFAPQGNGKTTWLQNSRLNEILVDTDDDFIEQNGIVTNNYKLIEQSESGILFLPTLPIFRRRHQFLRYANEDCIKEEYYKMKTAVLKFKKHPNFAIIEITNSKKYISHYEPTIMACVRQVYPDYIHDLMNEAKKNRIAAKKRIARSQILHPRKDDVSGSGTSRTVQPTVLFNEARRHIVKYDMEPKKESKVLTHTDIKPRYELPEYQNIIEIPPESPYHFFQMPPISGLRPHEQNLKIETYLVEHNLDPNFYKGDIHFSGATEQEQETWTTFFQQYTTTCLHPESMADNQAAALIPILTNNQVYVISDGQLTQRALMVYNRVGVTTAHGIEETSVIEIPKTKQQFAMRIISYSQDKDLAIFQLEKTAPQFKDIRGFIRSQRDTEILDGCDAFLLTVHTQRDTVIAQIRASKLESRTECRYNNRLRHGYLYGGTITGFNLPLAALTERGHCGSPGVILNSRYPRKIVSIHSAGSDYVAFGLPIYKEMFEIPTLDPQSIKPITILKHQEIEPLPVPEKLGEFKVLYELKHNNSTPNKTDIFRSPLQCDLFGDNFEPSILANYDTRNIDNVSIDHVTIEKWAKKQPEHLDLETLDYVVEEWANYYKRLIKKEKLQQFKLTKTEAINRVTYYSSSQPIQKDTSAGYPWRHRPGSKGKTLFIQPRSIGDTVLNCIPDDENGRDLNHAIDALINTCAKGERPAVVFASSAKDEVLKKKKIYPCRTRGFAGAPIDFSIAHRQYFHTAVCALTQTRHKHPIKVGIEANGNEWNDLYNWLAQNSTVGFDADFKDWDATIPCEIMKRLHIIYNAIYSACPRNPDTLEKENHIRKHLHSVLWGPLLTLGQYVVQAPGGQVSGQPATTIDNCFVGLIVLAYAWMKLAPERLANFDSFLINVRIAVYGDDQVVTVKPECLDFFNLETVKEIIGHDIGMEITSAAKDGKIIEFKHLEEMEFLKRNFLKIGPYYYGKLQETAFDKMLNWTHTYKKHHYFRTPDTIHYEPATIAESVISMMYELCIYPPDIYEGISNHCWDVFQKLGISKIIPTQRTMLMQRGIPHELFLSTFKQ